MRPGFKWIIGLLLLAVVVMLFGVPLYGLLFGAGFDPS